MQMNIRWWLLSMWTLSVLASCDGNKQQQQQGPPPAVPVTLDTVKASGTIYFDEYPGTVIALKQIQLTAQVNGYVTGIYFKDGDVIKQGQKLYTIDAQVYDANYQQAIANQQVQETNLVKAQKDADRYHELDKNDAIAKQQVDYADAALDAAKKQVTASKATVNSVMANVKFATIYAPFGGTIGISQVRTGTAVVAGQTILNTVSTDNPIAVDFPLDQKEIYRFNQLLAKGNSILKDSVFTIAFGDDTYPVPGSISFIDRAVDPQTGTIKARLTFANDKKLLKSGMNGLVRVATKSAGTSATQIPYKAVAEQLGEFFVYLVGDSNKVTQQKIKLGVQAGDNVIVKDGLKPGDRIVVQGVQNLKEGAVITTAPAQQPGAPQGKK